MFANIKARVQSKVSNFSNWVANNIPTSVRDTDSNVNETNDDPPKGGEPTITPSETGLNGFSRNFVIYPSSEDVEEEEEEEDEYVDDPIPEDTSALMLRLAIF